MLMNRIRNSQSNKTMFKSGKLSDRCAARQNGKLGDWAIAGLTLALAVGVAKHSERCATGGVAVTTTCFLQQILCQKFSKLTHVYD